jgi:hypothetical protein
MDRGRSPSTIVFEARGTEALSRNDPGLLSRTGPPGAPASRLARPLLSFPAARPDDPHMARANARPLALACGRRRPCGRRIAPPTGPWTAATSAPAHSAHKHRGRIVCQESELLSDARARIRRAPAGALLESKSGSLLLSAAGGGLRAAVRPGVELEAPKRNPSKLALLPLDGFALRGCKSLRR